MIRLGFIGLGLIGMRRAKIAQALGYSIAFAVNPDSRRRDALDAKDCVKAASLADLEAAGATAADVVMIAVPHDLALGMCRWSFDRGAHVLCEKPMGLSCAEARMIAASAQAAERHFCAGLKLPLPLRRRV